MLEEKFLNSDSENIEENIDQIAIKYMLNSFDKNKPHGDYNTINKFIKLLYLVKNDLKKNYMEAMNSRIHLNYSRIYGEYYYKSFPFIGNIITVDDISVIINKESHLI